VPSRNGFFVGQRPDCQIRAWTHQQSLCQLMLRRASNRQITGYDGRRPKRHWPVASLGRPGVGCAESTAIRWATERCVIGYCSTLVRRNQRQGGLCCTLCLISKLSLTDADIFFIVMKSLFPGFYAPNEQQLQELWSEGTFVFDANVLLSLYRYPQQAREDMFKVLEGLKERIWIPFQVALEYQRNRLNVIVGENAKFQKTLDNLHKTESDVAHTVSSLELERRGLEIDTAPLISALSDAVAKLKNAVDEGRARQSLVSHSDEIRDRLDNILVDGRVGSPPASQAEIDQLVKDGQSRYDNGIPPGFKDAAKAKNPAEATYFHDGMEYQAQFGDLIAWRQLLGHAKQTGLKKVILVTNDRKDDWWLREAGQTLGPQPQLVHEISREAGVGLFWMYSADQFLQRASVFLNASIDKSSVSEVSELLDFAEIAAPDRSLTVPEGEPDITKLLDFFGNDDRSKAFIAKHLRRRLKIDDDGSPPAFIRQAAAEWVVDQKGVDEVVIPQFGRVPEFIVKGPKCDRAVHFFYPSKDGEYSAQLNFVKRLSLALREKRFVSVTLAFVVPPFEVGIGEHLRRKVDMLATLMPEADCVFLAFDESFKVLMRV